MDQKHNENFHGVLVANKSGMHLLISVTGKFWNSLIRSHVELEPQAESLVSFHEKGDLPFAIKIYDKSKPKKGKLLWSDKHVNHWYRIVIEDSTGSIKCFRGCKDSLAVRNKGYREDMIRFMKMNNFYEVLGISRDATQYEIKKAWHQLSLQYHPDKNPTSVDSRFLFQKILEAHMFLSDEEKRREYDEYLRFKDGRIKHLLHDARRKNFLRITGVCVIAGIGCMIATGVVIFTGGIGALPVVVTMAAITQALMSAGIFGTRYLLSEKVAISGGNKKEFAQHMVASAAVGLVTGAAAAASGGAISAALQPALGAVLNTVEVGAITGAAAGATSGAIYATTKTFIEGAFLHEFEDKTNSEVAIEIMRELLASITLGAAVGAGFGALKASATPSTGTSSAGFIHHNAIPAPDLVAVGNVGHDGALVGDFIQGSSAFDKQSFDMRDIAGMMKSVSDVSLAKHVAAQAALAAPKHELAHGLLHVAHVIKEHVEHDRQKAIVADTEVQLHEIERQSETYNFSR